MREIKFRAWDGERIEPMDSDGFFIRVRVKGYEVPQTISLTNALLKAQLVLMQYTGLRDKNGREIYEGDILSDGLFKAKVDFWDGAFRINDEQLLAEFVVQDDRYQVIGNIYENPELLAPLA